MYRACECTRASVPIQEERRKTSWLWKVKTTRRSIGMTPTIINVMHPSLYISFRLYARGIASKALYRWRLNNVQKFQNFYHRKACNLLLSRCTIYSYGWKVVQGCCLLRFFSNVVSNPICNETSSNSSSFFFKLSHDFHKFLKFL